MNDPDQGSWQYTYFAHGKLKSQRDAKLQTTEMEYDLLGRMTKRTNLSAGEVSAWVYDEGHKGLGKLTRETIDNAQRDFNVQRSFTYNDQGQPRITSTVLDGKVYSQTRLYDGQGRVKKTFYPEVFYTTLYYHPTLGILENIADDKGQPLWSLQASNASGQVESYKLGNHFNVTKMYDPHSNRIAQIRGHFGSQTQIDQSYVWDSQGNLAARKDNIQNLFEQFTYDNLDRLKTNQLSGSTSRLDSVHYNAIGNITHKSGLGDYRYGQTSCGKKAGPHAVTHIGSKGEFCYDKNGSMIKGDGKRIAYTSFNKPSNITKGNQSTEFWYDVNRKRFKRKDGNKTTYYVGSYEKVVEGSSVTHRYRIGDFAVVEKKSNAAPFTNRFQVTDHLGSVIAAVNVNGSVTDRFSYDPWGLRRVLNGEIHGGNLENLTKAYIPRGYTGHEHIDGMNLIHMNGRVYMPEIGRFLSADPHIQSPGNLQSFNRYAYVWNNPLRYNDPSGYFVKNLLKKARPYLKPIIGIMLTAVTGGAYGALGANTFWSGALAGATGGAVTGGSKGFWNGMLTGGLLHGAGKIGMGKEYGLMTKTAAKKMGAHALIGGVNSKLSGGKFSHGALAMGFTAGATVASGGNLGYVGSALVGGSASAMVGGDFAYGAFQGAMSYGLNYCMSGGECVVGPEIPQGVGDFFAGFGDTITFGATKWVRENLIHGSVNYDSGYYDAGEVSSVLMTPVGRTAYAYRASRIPLRAKSGKEAFLMRDALKTEFRGPLAKPLGKLGRSSYEQLIKTKTPQQILQSTGKTNLYWNVGLIGGGGAAAVHKFYD